MLEIIKKIFYKINIIQVKNKKILTGTCLIFLMFIFIFSGAKDIAGKNGTGWQVRDGTEPVLRVHILAHNDTPEEQALKNRVRDDFLELTAHYKHKESWQELMETIEREKDLLEADLNEKISNYGNADNREAELKLQEEYFPLRHYGGNIYPPGKYTALIVTIGGGKGENWWCLLYPPLCFPLAGETEDEDEDTEIKEHTEHTEEKAYPEYDNDEVIEAVAGFNERSDQESGVNAGVYEADGEKEEKGKGRWKIKVWEWIKTLFEKA